MKLLAIDGNSLINRSFYAVRHLSAPDGTPTNALYGFLSTLFKLLADEQPDRVCVCFDVKGKTFRHERYEGYKAQRKPMPDDLRVQMPLLKQVLDLLGIFRLELSGYEADDLLGTLAKKSRESGETCVIVTGDKDSLQFIAQGATVNLVITKMGQTSTEPYDEQRFGEVYRGLSSERIVDLKAIMGDQSDNIPGVRGIGEKGALDLITRFGSLEGVYQNLDDPSITDSVRKKLIESKDSAFLSYELAKGVVDVPIQDELSDMTVKERDEGALYDFLLRYGLKTLIKRLELEPQSGEGVLGQFSAREHKKLERIDEIRALEQALKGGTPVSVLATPGLSALSIATDEALYYIPSFEMEEGGFSQLLKTLFSGSVPLNIHDAKAFLREGMDLGYPAFIPAFDSSLAAYLLEPTQSGFDIEKCALRFLQYDAPKGADYRDADAFSLLSGGEGERALCIHCDISHTLFHMLRERLSDAQMLPLLSELELPLLKVLAEMEFEGVLLDKMRLQSFGQELSEQIEKEEQAVYALAGEPFNIASPKQLGVILFEKLGLPVKKKTKSGYSTDIEVLEKLRAHHPVIEHIIAYRKYTKLKSTYVEGLSKVVADDGRVHTTFNQTVTATGRLSSTEPNLQNIPIRQELGTEIRRCFIAKEGCVLIDADYSQIELRLLAHIAQDEVMIQAFKEGEDIHTVTASKVFNVPLSAVTHEQRSRAKAVNFGIVYGISAFSLSDDIKVSVKEAQAYIDAYLAQYSGVKRYMDEIIRQAHEDGYVKTMLNRRRMLPELKSTNYNVRAFGERVALNTPIQGTAADIIKIAMIRVSDRLKREGMQTKLLLQVHDELILEAPQGELERAKVILKEEMEGAMQLSVDLSVSVSSGLNWYDAKDG